MEKKDSNREKVNEITMYPSKDGQMAEASRMGQKKQNRHVILLSLKLGQMTTPKYYYLWRWSMNSWPPYSDGCVVGKRQKNRCQKQRSWVVMEINHAGVFMVPLAQRAISDGTSLQDNVRESSRKQSSEKGRVKFNQFTNDGRFTCRKIFESVVCWSNVISV